MRNPKYRIFLILTAVLLCFSFIATPITALVPTAASGEASDTENKTPITTSNDDVKAKETPITTNDISFDIIEEMPQEGELGQESEVGNTTRANDQIISGNVYDGVYAIRNIGNGQYWMDLQQNIIDETAHIQQYNYTTSPNELFERAAMFKLSYVSATGSYIIRLMMNNLLTFELVEDEEDDVTYVKTKRIPANDSEVNPADTFIITYTSSGYTIRPYGSSVSGDQYICSRRTTASGMSGAPESYLVTGSLSSNERYGRWELRKYTGTTRSGYSKSISPSITNGLTVGDISTVTVYAWSTTVGANKPSVEVSSAYNSRVSVTDITSSSSFGGKFKLTALKAGKFELIYRIKNASGTNAYSSYQMYMAVPDFTSNIYCFRNYGTKQYMDVEGPSTAVGAYIQQWSYSGASQKQWIITPTSGGYYTIKSRYSNLYLGVDSSNTSLVKQYSTLNDYTQWYFYEVVSDYSTYPRYVIESKMWSVTGSLAAPSDTSGLGANLTMSIYTSDSSYRDEWELYPVYYHATLENLYDDGYYVYYEETASESAALIEEYSRNVAERFLELYGLALNVMSTTYYEDSFIDDCKGTVTLSNIDQLCSHTNNDVLPNVFDFVGNNTHTYAYWTAHGIEEEPGEGLVSYLGTPQGNRSFASATCIYMLYRFRNTEFTTRRKHTQGILMHELNHQYGAPDHYHEEDESGECKNKALCFTCNEITGRPESCIMNDSDQLLGSSTIICTGCKADIIAHLESHH